MISEDKRRGNDQERERRGKKDENFIRSISKSRMPFFTPVLLRINFRTEHGIQFITFVQKVFQ